MNQLKALVDLAHLHGLAVVLDLVYNHAGGDFGDESLYFFDRQSTDGGHRNSLYFTDKGHAGGLVFDFGKPEVRDFLIQNAKFFLDEYRVDGFRYDQVSVIDHDGAPHGWRFCQDLTSTLHAHRPGSFDKAEYWNVNPHVVKSPPEGAGFDTSLTDGLRIAIRRVIGEASAPDERPLDMTGLARSLWPDGFRSIGSSCRDPRTTTSSIAVAKSGSRASAIPANPRSWYGRSRARVATGIGLTAPGIPMLFMGQEFLEDKQWSDNFDFHEQPAAALGRARRGRQAHGRSPALHARVDSAALALSGLTRAGLPRRARARRRTACSHFTAGWRAPATTSSSSCISRPFNRFDYRIGFPGGGEWRGDLQQRRVRAVGQSGRRRQRRPGVRRPAADARLRPLCGAHAAGEQRARVRAVSGAATPTAPPGRQLPLREPPSRLLTTMRAGEMAAASARSSGRRCSTEPSCASSVRSIRNGVSDIQFCSTAQRSVPSSARLERLHGKPEQIAPLRDPSWERCGRRTADRHAGPQQATRLARQIHVDERQRRLGNHDFEHAPNPRLHRLEVLIDPRRHTQRHTAQPQQHRLLRCGQRARMPDGIPQIESEVQAGQHEIDAVPMMRAERHTVGRRTVDAIGRQIADARRSI